MSLDDRNRELNKKIAEGDLGMAVAVLVQDAKKRKRQVRLLTLSIVLDILLTIGLFYQSHRTAQLASRADSNSAAILRSCETSNEARANNKQLWGFLLSLPTPNAPTIQEQANRDKFAAYVNMTFAPRDCSKVVQ